MDSITPEKRSWVMAQVKSTNTRPEKTVRSLLHAMGYRFRLHRKDLPGKPDIVLPKYKSVIFVHGCFWHKHNCRSGNRMPKSKIEYWSQKLEGNSRRDRLNQIALVKMGWKVLVIWECMLKDKDALKIILRNFLSSSTTTGKV